jgi:hypothetical protein
MGRQLTRPRNASIAGAPSIAEAEILFSDTAQDVVDLPAGAVVLRAWAEILQAFNAGTTNVLEVGIAGTQGKYLAAADVAEGALGVSPAGGKGPFARITVAETVRAFFTQTGAAATTGRARVYIEYVRTAANG